MFNVQLRLALTVKVGPASASVAPTSTWSAVGEVSVVVVAPMPSFTNALTVADAVFTVRHPPALPLHCAFAWLTLMADPSTIAARRKRVAFIEFAPKFTAFRQVSVGISDCLFLQIRRDNPEGRNGKKRDKLKPDGHTKCLSLRYLDISQICAFGRA